MRTVFLLLVSFLLLSGCTQTEEGKASFGVLFLIIMASIAGLAAVVLNGALFLCKKLSKRMKEGRLRRFLSRALPPAGLVLVALSVIASAVLLFGAVSNFLRCSGGCWNVAGETVPLLLLSLVPAIAGWLQHKSG